MKMRKRVEGEGKMDACRTQGRAWSLVRGEGWPDEATCST